MDEYRSNSFKSKQMAEQNAPVLKKRTEKVISGNATVKKKNGVRKFADKFLAEDMKNVKSYFVSDVLVPSVKKLVDDIFTNCLDGIRMMLWGGKGKSKGSSAPASRYSYKDYYDRDKRDDDRLPPRVFNSGYNYDDIELDTRGDAEEVLTRMEELIAAYGIASVADYYDVCGLNGNYTDNNYGWTDLKDAYVSRVRDKYVIRFPKALPLN